VPAKVGGQYGASGQNREGGRARIVSRPATTDKRAMARAFGTTAKPSATVKFLTEAFPIRGTSTAEPKPTTTKSPDVILLTLNEARSCPTMHNAKRGAKKVRGKGKN